MIEKQERICPYLGLAGDPNTVYSVPSHRNRCYHIKPAAALAPEHQNAFCLTPDHTNCDVYKAKLPSSLPDNIRDHQDRDAKHLHSDVKRRKLFIRLGIFLGVLVLFVMFIWLGSSHAFLRFPGMGHSPLLNISTVKVEATPTFMVLPTQSEVKPTLSNLPSIFSATPLSPTIAPTVAPARALETPLGRTTQLIIHQVREGESLDLISESYGTTIEAIQAVNYFIPSPLLINALIIVPLDQTDVVNLPAFQAFQVLADISVEALAKKLDVDLSLLKQYIN